MLIYTHNNYDSMHDAGARARQTFTLEGACGMMFPPMAERSATEADGMGKASFFVLFCLLFLKGTAAGKLTRLQWTVTYPRVNGQHTV